MNDPKRNLPKIPPFVSNEPSSQARNQPAVPPTTSHTYPTRKHNGSFSERGTLNATILLISSTSLGLALMSGAWIGIDILENGLSKQNGLFAKVAVTGLTYLVGWVISLFGMRKLNNLTLPSVINIYSWLTLIGIAGLQIAIISKLFSQHYDLAKFIMYLLLFGSGLVALIGLHLLLEKHNLVPYSFPILFVSFAHLFLIVFHYVFVRLEKEKYAYFWGDATFFLITSTVGVLMLAHFGILSAFRNTIDKKFSENTDHFVPLD